MVDEEFEAEEEEQAAAEAAGIGGRAPSGETDEYGDPISEADRALVEAGEGESEGFELAEAALVEHASHGDEHAARRIIEDAALNDEDGESDPATYGEGDEESEPDA